MSGEFEETTGGGKATATPDSAEVVGAWVGKLVFWSIFAVPFAIFAGFMVDALDWAFQVGRSIIG